MWFHCPFAQVTLKAKKPNKKPYPKELNTYGDHLRKKRLDLDLSQPQVAKTIQVDENSITQWELNHTKPQVKQIPKIISFLGYSPKMYESKFKQYRIERGITQKEMARILDIDPTTLAKIENGNSKISIEVRKKLCYQFSSE